MRVKIISNGKLSGTHLVNAETGEEIENVVSILWQASARHRDGTDYIGSLAIALIEFADIGIEAEVNGTIITSDDPQRERVDYTLEEWRSLMERRPPAHKDKPTDD